MNEDDYEDAYDYAKELRGDDDEADFRFIQRLRVGILIAILVVFTLLGLVGCAHSLDDMYIEQDTCRSALGRDHVDCVAIEEKIIRREDRQARERDHKQWKQSCSNSGGIAWCDRGQCTAHDGNWQCLSQENFRRALDEYKRLLGQF